MIGIFKQKSPGNIVILLIFGLLIKLPLFLFPRSVALTEQDGSLYRFLVTATGSGNILLFSAISFTLLYLQALQVNYLVNEYRMITRPNYLAGMAYMLITSFLPEWSYLSAPLVANTLIIWMFTSLFRLYSLGNIRPQVYNIGLIAGVCSYIYFPSACFAFCALLGLLILRPFRLNEIVLFLLGCLTPYYFYGLYLFLTDGLNFSRFLPRISVSIPALKSSLQLAGAALLLAIPFLMGGFFIQNHLRKMLIQVRKNWSILLLYLLLAFFVPFVNGNSTLHAWVLVAAPFAAFHACAYFYQPKIFLSSLLFFIAAGYVIFLQFGTPTWH